MPRPRRTFRKNKMSVAKKALRLARKNRREHRADTELKFNLFSSNIFPSPTPFITSMFGLFKGVEVNERVGEKVHTTWLAVRGTIVTQDQVSNNGVDSYTIDTNSNSTRLMIVYDRVAAGANPNILAVMDTASTLSQRNISYKKRFKIIHDKVYDTSAYNTPVHIQFTRKLNLITTFNDLNFGTIVDINEGSFIYIVTSVIGGAITNVVISAKIFYTDN